MLAWGVRMGNPAFVAMTTPLKRTTNAVTPWPQKGLLWSEPRTPCRKVRPTWRSWCGPWRLAKPEEEKE